MVPEDGDPPRPRTSPGGDDAFAATIAPSLPGQAGVPGVPTLPLAAGTPSPPSKMLSAMESDQTMAAPIARDGSAGPRSAADGSAEVIASALPPLPTIPHASYKTDKEIARGGMGRIVAAEDQRLGRPVALKELIDPNPDALGRFQREALITARLQHPSIVPVYEAGQWPTGEPFFAMKMVQGKPLDQVIAAAKTLQERLALLPRITAAVDAIAYAHSKRVIHRDLKPANVLIGEYGETVVIDWGLAKDLDATDAGMHSEERAPRSASEKKPTKPTVTSTSSTLTIAGAVMGTPAYMAPEQARGEPLDERADVFALGAMLYHLLAGVPPYNARTATDVIAAAALGRVVPLLDREKHAPLDLVAIVNRAMAQETSDRYANAGELAEELRRFLTGQLVGAHHYTPWQKVRRFVKKHRAAVTISALSVLAFAVLGTLAIRRIVEERDAATRAREIAVTRKEAAEKLIDRMLSDVKDRLQQIGRLDILSNLGGEIRDYYGTLSRMPGGMPPEDNDRMALAVDLVGIAERESGRLDQALKTWTDARAKLAATVTDEKDPRTLLRRRMIARFDFEIGTVHQARGKWPAAVTAFTLARKEFDALREEAPNDRTILLMAADTHDKLGDLLRNDGKIDQALEEYMEAKTERELAGSRASSRPSEEILALSTSHLKLGSVYQARGESATALESYRSALKLRETLMSGQPDNVEVIEKVLDVRSTLAELQRQIGDDKSAIETYRAAVPIAEMLARRDPTNTTWKRQRANLLADLGFAMLDSGEFKPGLEQLQAALELQKELVAKDPKSSAWQSDMSRSLTRAGDGRMYLGEVKEAIERYGAALDIRRKIAKGDPKSAPYRRSVAWAYAKLANAFAFKGDATGAIAAHEEALELRTQLVTEAPAHSGYKNELASTEIALGRVLAATDAKRAKQLIDSGLTRARAMVSGDAINTEWKETLTQGLLAQAEAARLANDRAGRMTALAEARTLAHTQMERAPQNAHWPGYVAEVHTGLAELAADRRAAAAEWKIVRDTLEPLARAERLPATRKALLDRARGSSER